MTISETPQCNECDGQVRLPVDPMEGEVVSCPDCGASYELVAGEDGTLTISPAEVEGEDWGE